MECPGCAHINPQGARFCTSCGGDLSARCPACDSANPVDARFCAYCGALQGAPSAESNGAEALSRSGREAAPTPVVQVPEVPESFAVGRYRVQRFLGEGGKKKVYLVRDSLLDREVALSLIKTQGLDETGIERIKREAQLMGRLGDHPHIVSLYDIGEEGEQPYLVSQLMGGGDVEGLIERSPEHRPPLTDTLRIADQICQALEYAHQHGVIHRDLKPGNVWLTGDGTAKLGDFGLAMALDRTRLSVAGMIVGTVAYMPPEQALGRPSDGRSDLYSLGAMLYELVAGRPPFLGDDPVAIISQHINTQPVAPSWHNPDLPKPREHLILSLLAKAPEDRPESASAVRDQLDAIRTLLSQQETKQGQVSRSDETRNPLDQLAGGVFVGRETELVRLRASVDAIFGGSGQVVLLASEPGIGKTSLAEEATTYARLRGAQVLWSRNYEWEGAPAYWTWVQLIRSYVHTRDPQRLRSELGTGGGIIAHVVSEVRALLPDLESTVTFEGEEARFRLFDAVANFLRAASRNQPLVLVLDDLHWADAPSLLLLQYVARELRDARVLIIGSYRDMEIGRHHPLAGTLAELAREQRLERMTLRGLSRAEMARYVELTAGGPPPAGFVDAIVEQTAGNPFFVAEVVRLVVSEGALERKDVERWSVSLPQGVREVLGRRLDRLSAACNELLAVAAVIGREFELSLLAAVVEQRPDQVLETLEEALAARLLIEGDQTDSYRFSQELIREVLYEELSIARRRRLNGAVARALERLYAGNLAPHYAQLAHHFATAGPGEDARKAVDYYIKAAERAMTQAAWETAEKHYEQAVQILDVQEQPDPELLCQTLLALGNTRNIMSSTGDVPEAREAFLRAANLARNAGFREYFALAAVGYAGMQPAQTFGGVVQIELLEEARELLSGDETNLRALVLARLSLDRRIHFDDYEAMIRDSDEALTIAERNGDPETIEIVLFRRLIGCWHPERLATYEETITRYVDAASRSRFPAHTGLAIYAQMAFALINSLMDRVRLHRSEFEIWVTGLDNESLVPWESRAIYKVSSMFAMIEGRLSEAEFAIRRQSELADGELWIVWDQLVQLRWIQGEAIKQIDLLDQFEPRVRLGARFIDSYLLSAARLVWWLETDPQRAKIELRALQDRGFSKLPYDSGWFQVMAMVSEACTEIGDQNCAEELYELISPFRNLTFLYIASVCCWAAAEHYLGMLATVLERWTEAEEHFQRALEIHEEGGMRLWLAHTQFAYADMLIRRGDSGDQERALAFVDTALAEAEEMGAGRLERKALALKVQIQGILKA